MIYPNPSTALASVIIDELIRSGVGVIVASPGSRSTALLLAADARPEVEVVMVIDERSAGFHALGRAKATGEVGVVLTTSGTAVANLMPAVVEADARGRGQSDNRPAWDFRTVCPVKRRVGSRGARAASSKVVAIHGFEFHRGRPWVRVRAGAGPDQRGLSRTDRVRQR